MNDVANIFQLYTEAHALQMLQRADGRQMYHVNGKALTTHDDAYDDVDNRRTLTLKHGLLHSFNDEPAVEYYGGLNQGTKEWYHNGLRHRDDGAAYVRKKHNADYELQQWFQHDKLHRDDGAAHVAKIGNAVTQRWYQHNKLHRLDGPAAIQSNGDVATKHYAFDGVVYQDDAKHKKMWAQRVLKHLNQPSDDKSVTKYLLQMDAQQTADEI